MLKKIKKLLIVTELILVFSSALPLGFTGIIN